MVTLPCPIYTCNYSSYLSNEVSMISSSILSAYHDHVIIISESNVPFSVAGIIRECQQIRPDSCSA